MSASSAEHAESGQRGLPSEEPGNNSRLLHLDDFLHFYFPNMPGIEGIVDGSANGRINCYVMDS
jgi:hypothetical protein